MNLTLKLSDIINSGILSITAVILVWYTHETKLLRQEAQKSNQARQIPYLRLKWGSNRQGSNTFTGLELTNVGPGIAINIKIGVIHNNKNYYLKSVDTLAPNKLEHINLQFLQREQDEIFQRFLTERAVNSDDFFRVLIEYTDMSHKNSYTAEFLYKEQSSDGFEVIHQGIESMR